MGVIALVILVYKPAEWLTHRVVKPQDSFAATVTINVLCTDFLRSVFQTVIETWIGIRHICWDLIFGFFYQWPREFYDFAGCGVILF